MSDPSDRRRGDRVWTNPVTFEMIERNRKIAEYMALAERWWAGWPVGARERAAAEIDRFRALGLAGLQPLPGQRADSAIDTGGIIINKRSEVARFYARTHRLERFSNGQVMAHVQVNCSALDAARLRKALSRAQNFTVRQMRNLDLRPAGWIHGCHVSEDSVASLQLMVTDASSLQKLATKTYSGCVISVSEEGDLADVSLVDSPFDFVGVELAKGGPADQWVIAKIYDGALMRKDAAKAARKADPDWALAKEMVAKYGGSRRDNYAALKKVGRPEPAPAPLTPAQNELAHVGALIKAGTISGQLAASMAKRADDALRIEQIKAAQRRPLFPGRQS